MNAHPSSLSDRELLELAAKAAGYEHSQLAVRPVFLHGDDVTLMLKTDRGGDMSWNPLEDDGDALRLAVKLRMTVYPAEKTSSGVWVNVCIGYGTGDVEIFEKVQGDSLIATRRAIVRAAAELAK